MTFSEDGKAIGTDEELMNRVCQFEHDEAIADMKISVDSVDRMMSLYQRRHRLITAAGGLVVRDGKCLVIDRRGHLDLPKGKTEVGESPEETAVREVAEEVGLSGMKIEDHVAATYHTYNIGSETVVKRTDWFLMRLEDMGVEPVLQTEEDIVGSKWMSADEMKASEQSTYTSLRPIFGSLSEVLGA